MRTDFWRAAKLLLAQLLNLKINEQLVGEIDCLMAENQVLKNQITIPLPSETVGKENGKISKKERLGGLLKYYYRQAAGLTSGDSLSIPVSPEGILLSILTKLGTSIPRGSCFTTKNATVE